MHQQHVFLFYGSIIDDSHHEAHTPYLLQCLALDVKLSNQDLSIHFLVSLCSSSGAAASIHEEYSGSNVEYSEAARAMCLNMTGWQVRLSQSQQGESELANAAQADSEQAPSLTSHQLRLTPSSSSRPAASLSTTKNVNIEMKQLQISFGQNVNSFKNFMCLSGSSPSPSDIAYY